MNKYVYILDLHLKKLFFCTNRLGKFGNFFGIHLPKEFILKGPIYVFIKTNFLVQPIVKIYNEVPDSVTRKTRLVIVFSLSFQDDPSIYDLSFIRHEKWTLKGDTKTTMGHFKQKICKILLAILDFIANFYSTQFSILKEKPFL